MIKIGLKSVCFIQAMFFVTLLSGCGIKPDYVAGDISGSAIKENETESLNATPSDSEPTPLLGNEDVTGENPYVIYRGLLEQYRDVVVEGEEWNPALELGDPAFFIMDYYVIFRFIIDFIFIIF